MISPQIGKIRQTSCFLLTVFGLWGISLATYANEVSSSSEVPLSNEVPSSLVKFVCVLPNSSLPSDVIAADVEEKEIFTSFPKHPTLIALSRQYGMIRIIQWKNTEFQRTETRTRARNRDRDRINYTPKTRCQIVAQRFNDFYNCDVLPNMTQGEIQSPTGSNKYPAIFVRLDEDNSETPENEKQIQIDCLRKTASQSSRQANVTDLYLLLMLSQQDNRAINREFCEVRNLREDSIIDLGYAPISNIELPTLYDTQQCQAILQEKDKTLLNQEGDTELSTDGI